MEHLGEGVGRADTEEASLEQTASNKPPPCWVTEQGFKNNKARSEHLGASFHCELSGTRTTDRQLKGTPSPGGGAVRRGHLCGAGLGLSTQGV